MKVDSLLKSIERVLKEVDNNIHNEIEKLTISEDGIVIELDGQISESDKNTLSSRLSEHELTFTKNYENTIIMI